MGFGHAQQRELSDIHNVARYCRKRDIAEDGIPTENAFRLREDQNECYLSTNWLEYFHGINRRFQIDCVIQSLKAKGRDVRNNASFAVLNVGTAISECGKRANVDIRFITLGESGDPSHAGVFGMVNHNAKTAAVLAKLVDSSEVVPVVS